MMRFLFATILITVPLLVSSCTTRNPWVYNNPLIRAAFYPDAINMRRGLPPDTPGGQFDHSAFGIDRFVITTKILLDTKITLFWSFADCVTEFSIEIEKRIFALILNF